MRYFFVSPHLDDAVLSCGGYIHRLINAGENVTIATVVTADPPLHTKGSWLMHRNHMAWRLGDSPFIERRREDEAALDILGASLEHLDCLDAIYRQDYHGNPLYTKKSFVVPVHPNDWAAFEPLVRQKLHPYLHKDVQVFCPLAIGSHVDHVIIRHAVESLCNPQQIIYYEDYPYADQSRLVERHLKKKQSNLWRSIQVQLTQVEIEARIDASACYVSQVNGLFPTKIERIQEIIRSRLPFIGIYFDRSPDQLVLNKRINDFLRSYIAQVGGEQYWITHETKQVQGT